MIETLAMALQAQQVSEEKIEFIISKLSQINENDSDDSIWRTFCESCLEVGVDPQAVFALTVSNYEDALENMDIENF
jgi:hypothetical protein